MERLATSKPRPRDYRWLPCFSVEQYVFVAVTRLAGATLQYATTRMPTVWSLDPPKVQTMLVHASQPILGIGAAIKKPDRPREADPNARAPSVTIERARARSRSQCLHLPDSCTSRILSDHRDFHSCRVPALPAVRCCLFVLEDHLRSRCPHASVVLVHRFPASIYP